MDSFQPARRDVDKRPTLLFSVGATMTVFSDAADAVGSFLQSDATVGGYVIGIGLLVTLVIVFLILPFGRGKQDSLFMISVGMAVVFNAMVEWWPFWTVIIFAMILGWVILDPLGGTSKR